MAPEDRRQAIVEATTQLVLDFGPEVSTRQIADACGLAEGTLFRVFESKRDILKAVVEHIIDPAVIIDEIHSLDEGLSLPEVIAGLVAAVDSASQRIRSVMAALHSQMGGDRPAGPPHAKDHDKFIERHTQLGNAMASVLSPHADQLRVDAEVGAAFIQTSVFASGIPMLGTRIADRTILTDLLVHALVKEPPCSAMH
jgi:AcrR family transcriptional regulator